METVVVHKRPIWCWCSNGGVRRHCLCHFHFHKFILKQFTYLNDTDMHSRDIENRVLLKLIYMMSARRHNIPPINHSYVYHAYAYCIHMMFDCSSVNEMQIFCTSAASTSIVFDCIYALAVFAMTAIFCVCAVTPTGKSHLQTLHSTHVQTGRPIASKTIEPYILY